MAGFSHFASPVTQAIGFIAGCALLVSCSGRLYTLDNPTAAKVYEEKDGYEGVLFYLPNHFYEISWTTAIVRDGKVTHSATASGDKQCAQDIRIKEVVRADFRRPYQLVYDPGFLEKYTFKAEFDQGVLKSVNAESTPDRGETLKNLLSAAKDAATIAGGVGVMPIGGFPCTDLPELKFIEKVADVCPNGACDFQKYKPSQVSH